MDKATASPTENRGPLTGVRVLDLSAYHAGPYGCSMLADMGAEVIKIEPPEGDNARHYPSTLASEARGLLGSNRSKRGLVLDLKQREGRAVLHRMVRHADVLVHNFRPAVPPRLGLTYEELSALNRGIIVCAVTGYGDRGPLKDKPGFDQVLQTMTGICAGQGRKGPPEIVYGSAVDYYAAAQVTMGVTAALYHREKTGEGQFVGVSLLQAALTMQSMRLIWAEGEPKDIPRDMHSGGITGLHPTREGSLYLSANTPHFWGALCEMVGLPELATDPRYDSIRKRAEHIDEIVPKIRGALAARTALEWEALFGERVPCAAARRTEDMFEHPQVLAMDLIAEVPHPRVGSYRTLQRPISFSATPCGKPFAAPLLGEHSEAILREEGYAPEEIAALREAGVLGGAAPAAKSQ
ncbi:CaiB/BaiF CoA transferase family protein [Caenimonas aquaedulcis]|uniref:CoA transferase n=1 Tax=Caenimonas aquaedulcis TaxID=2793270 RepID=A0A931MGM3_9BURK|nr:CoA transferase [Caenimonas aquaedulcis]MBG9387964.1 CoA transferase [Caenimonas aquaedulcis]